MSFYLAIALTTALPVVVAALTGFTARLIKEDELGLSLVFGGVTTVIFGLTVGVSAWYYTTWPQYDDGMVFWHIVMAVITFIAFCANIDD